tara:strand:- start:2 stop:1132 length:1131 start_codon:yes stop_codon:yes gene_type:complete
MGLFSKLRKKVKAKKVAKKIISPKIAKSGRGGILNEIRERGGFAGAIPLPRRNPFINRIKDLNMDDRGMMLDRFRQLGKPRLGFGLGELLPRIKDKVPLAPVFSGMPMPQMVGEPQMLTQPISRVPVEENISEIYDSGFAMRDKQMDMMEPRMMMADGDVALSGEAAAESLDSFLNANPEQVEFGMESRLRNVTLEMMDALSRGDLDAVRELEAEKIMLEKMLKDKKMPKYGPPPQRPEGMAAGGEAKPDFLDFDNDGDKEESMKQALQQKNKFAEGDEVSMMLMEMDEGDDMSEEEMEGLEGLSEVSGPETEMLNNIINQIIELIAQGATEEQIIQFLMEQGLDEEDITEVMSMLSQEMTAGGEEGIDSQLAALG